LWSAAYTLDPEFRLQGAPEVIMGTYAHNSWGLSFDVSADGQSFLILKPVHPVPSTTRIRLVTNWFEELNSLAPND
jgi:hypothetical protein